MLTLHITAYSSLELELLSCCLFILATSHFPADTTGCFVSCWHRSSMSWTSSFLRKRSLYLCVTILFLARKPLPCQEVGSAPWEERRVSSFWSTNSALWSLYLKPSLYAMIPACTTADAMPWVSRQKSILQVHLSYVSGGRYTEISLWRSCRLQSRRNVEKSVPIISAFASSIRRTSSWEALASWIALVISSQNCAQGFAFVSGLYKLLQLLHVYCFQP